MRSLPVKVNHVLVTSVCTLDNLRPNSLSGILSTSSNVKSLFTPRDLENEVTTAKKILVLFTKLHRGGCGCGHGLTAKQSKPICVSPKVGVRVMCPTDGERVGKDITCVLLTSIT